MEERMKKISHMAGKYRYVLLVLALGMVLMSLPEGEKNEAAIPEPIQAEDPSLEIRLEGILGKIQGVGTVSVLLTEAAGQETVYRTDTEESQSENGSSLREDTVLITGSDREEGGLVLQTLPPVYRGAIIVCQGADQPAVALSVVEAVANATGIPSSRITVLKMK